VRFVVSHVALVGLATPLSELVKTTLQVTVLLLATVILVSVLFVCTVAGEAVFAVNVIVGSVYSTVAAPGVQLVRVPSYRVKSTVPFRAVPFADVIVAESFGSQFCAVVMDDVSCTLKHSPVLSGFVNVPLGGGG